MTVFIDAGVEHIHIQADSKQFLIKNNDNIKALFEKEKIFDIVKDKPVYITGKLAEIVKETLGGKVILAAAALWSAAKKLQIVHKNPIGILDLSASGFMAICVDKKGKLKDDLLVVNPKCGAGTGVNMNRILQKLDIQREDVDNILKDYMGKAGKEKREKILVRSDRCGVFASSATISDKNQGIPLDFALAVTMKSEVLKACKKMIEADTVYLSGRVFMWQYARDCAEDYLKSIGVNEVCYDKKQSILIEGMKYLAEDVGEFKEESAKLKKPEELIEYPSFSELKNKYEKTGRYIRLADHEIPEIDPENLMNTSVNIGLDVGSTMAKMVIQDMNSNILFYNSYENHGDTIETIKHIFSDLKKKNIDRLKIQHIGITGSGRYQVQKVLRKVYPSLEKRIFVMVENYAHAHGSIEYAKEHIVKTEANPDFCVLVDIGGEDTKVSVISMKKKELFDNVMNIKCSAGTGSLMDTLKSMFDIEKISVACKMALNSKKAYEINATCAVFLMENARKMQAQGYGKDEILASCNYAIVENMSRTLWNHIDFPKNSVILLHGQTMLSEPLPLAVTHRIQEKSDMYCVVPPLPGHRACIGLLKSIEKKDVLDESFALNDLIDLKFGKKIVICRGTACGDMKSCCARTLLSSDGLKVTLGGCTAVNELAEKSRTYTPDAYKEIWQLVDSKMPKSDSKNRLVIPRSFAVSEQAYFLSKIFSKLGIPVHVDNITENDILKAQPLFDIDICAPLIGATGQYIRLAKEKHGIILVPQIDFLPTGGASLGRTCTTNQGGVVIAKHYAQMKEPDANFVLFDLTLRDMGPENIAGQMYEKLTDVFAFYGLDVSEDELTDAIKHAIKHNLKIKEEIAEKTAGFLEKGLKEKRNISIVCAREYILNPGIYDSHVGKLLKDKGVIALPAYAFETTLDEEYSYIYWRNPHDIISKVHAIEEKRFHKILKKKKLSKLVKQIETDNTGSTISTVQVSTFRCGPDTVTLPTVAEITKNSPSLLIQSDAMIKELAHLENRVNTFINQLNKGLHDEFEKDKFSIHLIDEFGFDRLNKKTDVIYFPTLHDNRALTSAIKAAGITAIDNFDEEKFNLEKKVRLGRKFAGDSICAPLAAVYADIHDAYEDFKKRKKSNDPLVAGKKRVLIFDNKGTGPCRQGQYYEQHKLLLFKDIGSRKDVKLMVGHEKDGYNVGLPEWALILAFEGVIVQSLLHSILFKAASSCKDHDEFEDMNKDYLKLKDDIYRTIESIRPNAFSKLGLAGKYFGYGLYNNNGLRKILQEFSEKWVRESNEKIRIHVEGEAYMRVAQIHDIFNSIVDSIGFNSFELSYSPVWSYLELLIEFEKLNGRNIKLDILIWFLRNILTKPLYKAAKVDMPHKMSKILNKTKTMLPTLKPHGELPPYIGEAIANIEEGTDLYLNIAPEGCMVSSMGEIFGEPILNKFRGKTRIESLFTLNGELDEEKLRISLLKTLGPVGFYEKV